MAASWFLDEGKRKKAFSEDGGTRLRVMALYYSQRLPPYPSQQDHSARAVTVRDSAAPALPLLSVCESCCDGLRSCICAEFEQGKMRRYYSVLGHLAPSAKRTTRAKL